MYKKYIAYILTGVLTLGTLTPITYATPLYQSNIEFEQNELSAGKSQVVVYDSLNNPTTLSLDTQGPIVPQSTAYYKNNIAILKATEQGNAGLWKVVAQENKDAGALTGGTFLGNAASQIAEVTLPDGFNVEEDHLYVVDKGGNLSEPISLVQDTAPPSAIPTYPGGGIVLNVTDAVGIAQIDETPYSTYPTATAYPVPANADHVTVTDALGNSTDISIDTTVPQVTRVAKKGTTVMLSVTTAGVALDKISESDDSSEDGIYSFEANEQTGATKFLTTSADTLYVYDIAGHSVPIDLTNENILDTQGPAYEGPTYVNGDIKILVTDAKAGIKSINGSTTGYTNYPTTQQEYIVPANVSQVILVDALDNQTNVSIDRVLPQLTNIYVTDEGKTMITASDASGISAVKYYVNNEVSQTLEVAGAPTITPIEIPANITSIGVVDAFGNECPLNLANITMPTIQNIYKKAPDVYSLEVANITEIYCKNPTKQVLEANPQAINTIEVPEGVETLYVTDTNHNEVAIDISGVDTRVTKAILSHDAMRMMVNISSERNITGLTYLDANGETVGTEALDEPTMSLFALLEVPDNTASFNINYATGKALKVVLDQDLGAPQATNIYKTSDGKVYVTLEDNAGLSRIAYYVNGQEQSIVIYDAPTIHTQELNLEGVNRILVYDVFREVTPVKIGDDAVSTIVEAATISGDGQTAQVNITTGKPITSITYVYPDGSTVTKNILGNNGEFNGTLNDIAGATSIVFTHPDGSTDTIPLVVDDAEPTTSNAHVVDGNVVITVSDPAGVKEVRNSNNEVIATFNPPVVSANVTLPNGTTGIKVCDALGNESEDVIAINGAQIPTVENIYINDDGKLSVDTTGITEIYYIDDEGDKQVITNNPSASNQLDVPEGVGEIFFGYGENRVISMPIGDVAEVSKAIISEDGEHVAFDTTKPIAQVICYDENGDPIGQPLTGAQIGDIMSVPEGTASIGVTYSDGTKNKIDLEPQAPAAQSNAYKSNDDGSTTLTLTSNAGIDKVTYELGGVEYEIEVGGDPSITVEIPEGAQNVKVIDIFNEPEDIILPQDPPTVEKPKKDEDGNTVITSVNPITYVDPEGHEHQVQPSGGVVIIPAGIEEITVNSVPPVGMNISNITTTVGHATVNDNGSKLALNISGDKEIVEVVCYNQDGEPVGTIDITGLVGEDGTSINGVLDLPEGTSYVKVNYEGGTSTKITPTPAQQDATSSNVTSMGDGEIAVTLEDNAGIESITYYVNDVPVTIPVEGNPTKITQELKLPEGVTTIYVNNSFGESTQVVIGAPTATVSDAIVDETGKAIIGIEGDKTISTITYIDGEGKQHTVTVNSTQYNEILETNGATSITVNYQDGTKSQIKLAQDTQGPSVTNVCREYATLVLNVDDPSGIARIVDENGVELAVNPDGKIRVPITSDLEKIYVYDNLGHETVVMLNDYPMVDNIQKTENGTILVDTDGITEIYYYNEKGRKIVIEQNPDGTSEIRLPDGIEKFYMTDENGNEIEKSVSDAKEIEKTVIKGTQALLDVDTTHVDEVVCYSATGRVLGTVEPNQIGQNGLVNVPEGTASIRVVYDDGTTNKVELTPYAPTEDSNAYQSGEDGMVTITLENSAGIGTITFVSGGQPHQIDLEGVTSGQIELPSDATNIIVTDGFGQTKPISIPQDMPRVTDIQRDGDGQTVVTSNKALYYEDETGHEQLVEIDDTGRYVIPEGVEEVYTKEDNEVGITIDVSQVSTTVATAAISGDGGKISLNVDSTKALSQVVFYNAQNEPVGTAVELSGTAVNTVINNVPANTAYVKVEYVGGTSTKVVLAEDSGEPEASNTVALENGHKLVTLEDAAGISRITYIDENEDVQEIQVQGNPTKVVQELDLAGIEQITVYDMFGTPKVVDISEENMDTVIQDMATNTDGSGVFLNLFSGKGIDKLEYVDDYGVAHNIPIAQNIDEFRGAIDTVNADRIVVTHRDGTTSNVPLVVETNVPSNDETVKNEEGKNIKTNISDNRGIKSITYGGQVVTQGLENYPKNVVLEIKIVDVSGLSLGSLVRVMDNDENTTITIISDEEEDDITVTNVVNNSETLTLTGATVDSTGPEASAECEEAYFVLTARDEESGILRVVGKETGNTIFEPDGCPETFTSPQTAYPVGDKNLYVYNGVGLRTTVSIARNDNEPPKIMWAYKNLEKNYIYLVMKDESGIDRIEDQDGNVRVVFERE